MSKRIFWKQTVLEVKELASWLTTHNLQESKFKITYMQPGIVLLVWVDKEIPNNE